MATIRRTDPARQDLEEIWLSIAVDNPAAGDRLIDRFELKLQMLAENPRIGRERPELAPALRSFPVGNYPLFYRPISGGSS